MLQSGKQDLGISDIRRLTALYLIKAIVIKKMEKEFGEKKAAYLDSLGETTRIAWEKRPHIPEAIFDALRSAMGIKLQEALMLKYRDKINTIDNTVIPRIMFHRPISHPTLEELRTENIDFLVLVASHVVERLNLLPVLSN